MRIIFAVLAVSASLAMAVSFDFEGVADITELQNAGWTFTDGSATTGTITLETGIVHSGSQALRLSYRDAAFYPINNEYGTLTLWFYDHGYLQSDYDFTSANGPTFGLQKSIPGNEWTYPGGATAEYEYTYGIGGGLVHKSFLNSNGGYAYEYGQDEDITRILQDQVEADVANAVAPRHTEQAILDSQGYNGWGIQSWFSPAWMGGGRGEGWTQWSISYEEDGVVVITLVTNAAGNQVNIVRTATPDTVTGNMHAFDGTYGGGVESLFLYGGSSAFTYNGQPEDESWYGDVIVDDIVWTPVAGPSLPGDANGDNTVNIQDFIILKQNYGTTTGATWAMGDFNGDGAVNIQDFIILKQNYGTSI